MEKWYSLMPETAKEWWRMFFDSIDVSEENHSQVGNCPIYALKDHVHRPIEETDKAHEISEKTKALREKELAPLEQVNNYLTINQVSGSAHDD